MGLLTQLAAAAEGLAPSLVATALGAVLVGLFVVWLLRDIYITLTIPSIQVPLTSGACTWTNAHDAPSVMHLRSFISCIHKQSADDVHACRDIPALCIPSQWMMMA